jgi:16S rRNA (guanine1207-N2)-methyltransferase
LQVADGLEGNLAGLLVEPLDKQRAFEMVEFVLEQAGFKFIGFKRHLVAIHVPAHDVHDLRTGDLPRQAGNRKASFFEDPLALRLHNLWVHDRLRAHADVPNEETLLHANLRRSQTDTWRLVHRFEHVVDKTYQFSIDVSDRLRLLAQHWIPDNTYVISGHRYQATQQPGTVVDVSDTHYFDDDPSVASSPSLIEVNLPDLSVMLTSDRGVFSADKLDVGTKLLLLEAPPLKPNDDVILDIGCGWGPIACVAATRAPHAQVWAIDVNERARSLTAGNAESLGAGERVHVAAPDDVPDDLVVNRILSNPPIRVGKKSLHEILLRWLPHLAPNGMAHLVVQRHLGADSLARWLIEQGYPTKRLAVRAGFRILEVRPS